jgi:hypothetical protein
MTKLLPHQRPVQTTMQKVTKTVHVAVAVAVVVAAAGVVPKARMAPRAPSPMKRPRHRPMARMQTKPMARSAAAAVAQVLKQSPVPMTRPTPWCAFVLRGPRPSPSLILIRTRDRYASRPSVNVDAKVAKLVVDAHQY